MQQQLLLQLLQLQLQLLQLQLLMPLGPSRISSSVFSAQLQELHRLLRLPWRLLRLPRRLPDSAMRDAE